MHSLVTIFVTKYWEIYDVRASLCPKKADVALIYILRQKLCIFKLLYIVRCTYNLLIVSTVVLSTFTKSSLSCSFRKWLFWFFWFADSPSPPHWRHFVYFLALWSFICQRHITASLDDTCINTKMIVLLDRV